MLDYDRLLDTCFEIEGLLTLLKAREGAETPDEVFALLVRKVQQLSASLGADAPQAVETATAAEFEESSEADETPAATAAVPAADEEIDDEVDSELSTPDSPHRLNFTLNDRYRFRRELFAGSDADFADAAALLAAMGSLAEAEEYLYGDLGWDPESEDVKAFIDVIKPQL